MKSSRYIHFGVISQTGKSLLDLNRLNFQLKAKLNIKIAELNRFFT